jgi:hypothetical protein
LPFPFSFATEVWKSCSAQRGSLGQSYIVSVGTHCVRPARPISVLRDRSLATARRVRPRRLDFARPQMRTR